jgi:endonuclease/exonuclease/phosphatase family metal-dependent hydrolase
LENINVLTLNIHKGFSSGNLRFTLEEIRAQLHASESNIVFLQEVVGENAKRKSTLKHWPEQSQFEYLADSVWSHFAYGKNAIYQHGHHGNAILSEIPFSTSQNIDISLIKYSQRGFLHGVLENGAHALCVHLGLFDSERKRQTDKLIQHIADSVPSTAPLLLAGDFNDWNRKCHRQLIAKLGLVEAFLSKHKQLALTFPSRLPMLAMDRIYTRGFEIHHAEVLAGEQWHTLSDHYPLRAELKLPQR